MNTDTPTLAELRLLLPPLFDAIPGSDPAGISLSETPELEQLREARREDDATLPTGIWQVELKRGNWDVVDTLASNLLRQRSKDLLVAAWLGEAWVRRYQLPGLCTALELVKGLCERYAGLLFPRPQGDDASWLGPPMAWLARHYSVLLNINLPMLVASVNDAESLTLDQWMRAQQQALSKSEERRAKALTEEAQNLLRHWRAIVLAIPLVDLAERLQLLHSCALSVDDLNRWSNDHLGEDAPSFAALQKILNQHIQALQEFIAMHPEPVPAPVDTPAEPTTIALQPPNALTPQLLSQPDSRQAAYRQLKVISDYLALVDRHSPVPYLINRAIEWGDMPFQDLMAELVNADVDTRRIWKVLGVLP